MTNAVSGFGTLLQLSDGAVPPATIYTSIAEIAGLTGPGVTRNAIDATHMESPGESKEFIAGFIDSGEGTLDVNFLPNDATQSDLLTNLFASPTNILRGYRIVWPDLGATTLTGTVAGSVWTTSAAHGWLTGQPIKFTTTGSLPTSSPQIRLGTVYYAGVLSTTTFNVYPTSADAAAGVNQITFSSAGVGVHSVLGGTSWVFSAFVTGFPPAAPKDDRMSAQIAFKLSGLSTVSP